MYKFVLDNIIVLFIGLKTNIKTTGFPKKSVAFIFFGTPCIFGGLVSVGPLVGIEEPKINTKQSATTRFKAGSQVHYIG